MARSAATRIEKPSPSRKVVAKPKPKRDVTKLLKLTAEEAEEMERAAQRVGLPVSSWIRNTCLLRARGELY